MYSSNKIVLVRVNTVRSARTCTCTGVHSIIFSFDPTFHFIFIFQNYVLARLYVSSHLYLVLCRFRPSVVPGVVLLGKLMLGTTWYMYDNTSTSTRAPVECIR